VTLGAWLRDRTPTPPERLLARVEDVLGDRCARDAEDACELCLDAAETLLRDLTTRAETGREAALDLLTVDALATFAFEAAASVPDRLRDRTESAMTRLAACAAASNI
jgi:hypothetical protein